MPESDSESIFQIDRIRKLVELMKEHDLNEIDLREESQRIRLCRGGSPLVAPAPAPAMTAPPAPFAPASAAAPTAAAAADEENIAYITSPMIGTFYARPNPTADSYVKVGDHVDPETTVCIVEAMKVFNEIPSEVRGKIVAALVDDESPVEFGQKLFKIDTSL